MAMMQLEDQRRLESVLTEQVSSGQMTAQEADYYMHQMMAE
jgi:hypothetical protein